MVAAWRGGVSGLTVEDVDGNVGPELTEGVGGAVAEEGVSVLGAEIGPVAIGLGVVGGGEGLGSGAAEEFGVVELVMAVVVAGDGDLEKGVTKALPFAALAHGVVALVLMEDGGDGPDDEVVTGGFIKESAPSVSPKTGDTFA